MRICSCKAYFYLALYDKNIIWNFNKNTLSFVILITFTNSGSISKLSLWREISALFSYRLHRCNSLHPSRFARELFLRLVLHWSHYFTKCFFIYHRWTVPFFFTILCSDCSYYVAYPSPLPFIQSIPILFLSRWPQSWQTLTLSLFMQKKKTFLTDNKIDLKAGFSFSMIRWIGFKVRVDCYFVRYYKNLLKWDTLLVNPSFPNQEYTRGKNSSWITSPKRPCSTPYFLLTRFQIFLFRTILYVFETQNPGKKLWSSPFPRFLFDYRVIAF